MTLQELTRLETSGTSELLCVRALPASLEGKAFTGISQTFFRPSANSTYCTYLRLSPTSHTLEFPLTAPASSALCRLSGSRAVATSVWQTSKLIEAEFVARIQLQVAPKQNCWAGWLLSCSSTETAIKYGTVLSISTLTLCQSCRTPLARLHVHSHDELLAVCLNSTRRICPTPPPTPLLPTKAARSTLRPRVNTSSSSIPASQTQMNLKSQHICRRMVSRLP